MSLFTFPRFNPYLFRLKPSLDFVYWNTEGWKTGLCNVPPVGQTHSLLMLANNTCITKNFGELRDRFVKLYKRKVSYLDILEYILVRNWHATLWRQYVLSF